MKTIGQVIRELRKKRGMRQSDLGNIVGLSATAVSRAENDDMYLTESRIQNLAKALDCSVEFLLAYDIRPPFDDMGRRAKYEPAYGIALRRMWEADVKVEELIDWLEKKGCQ